MSARIVLGLVLILVAILARATDTTLGGIVGFLLLVTGVFVIGHALLDRWRRRRRQAG